MARILQSWSLVLPLTLIGISAFVSILSAEPLICTLFLGTDKLSQKDSYRFYCNMLNGTVAMGSAVDDLWGNSVSIAASGNTLGSMAVSSSALCFSVIPLLTTNMTSPVGKCFDLTTVGFPSYSNWSKAFTSQRYLGQSLDLLRSTACLSHLEGTSPSNYTLLGGCFNILPTAQVDPLPALEYSVPVPSPAVYFASARAEGVDGTRYYLRIFGVTNQTNQTSGLTQLDISVLNSTGFYPSTF